MEQQEWLDKDSELVLAYIRKLKVEFKEEPSIATVVNGAMIRAEHCGLFGQSNKTTLGNLKSAGPASNTSGWGTKAIKCPECETMVEPLESALTKKMYYKCPTCSDDKSVVFINQDGTAKRLPNKRKGD